MYCTETETETETERGGGQSGVRDLFALGLEADRHEEIVVSKFERKKLAKVRTTYLKKNILKKMYILSLAIQRKAQSHSDNT